MRFGLGQSIRRREDACLVVGGGSFQEDRAPDDALRAAFLRSPVAHARIMRLDADAAREVPGVRGVLLGADFEAAGVNDCEAVCVPNRDGTTTPRPKRPLVATDRVRFVGEPVALVLAETLAAARDACELIAVDYQELPAVTDTATADRQPPPALHECVPDNRAFDWAFGDETVVDAVLAECAHRVELALVNNRVVACPMEPRGAAAHWQDTRLHVDVGIQNVWRVQRELATRFGLAPEDVRVTSAHVGGGFGTKAMPYPEFTAVAHAARVVGQPVRWMSDRSEAFVSDAMGRDHVTRAVAGFDAALRLRALRVDNTIALGAYLSQHGAVIPSELMVKVLPGAYDFAHLYFGVRGVYTNTTPTDAYRGAGRPEANYVIERLMDLAARQFGVCPLELRARNFIRAEQFPYRSAAAETIDVGDFHRVLQRARKAGDIAGFPARRAASAAAGRLRGLGTAYYTEVILGAMDEGATLRMAADGMWELLVGTQTQGQGHETAYLQILHAGTGIRPERVRVVEGDTEQIPEGGGTGGSRSLTTQGTAICAASDRLIEQLTSAAEDILEAGDIGFGDGVFRVAGTDRAISIDDLADALRAQGRLEVLDARARTTLAGRSFPNGCHLCEIEIDPGTGAFAVVRYTAVDDFGVLVNPLLVEGQVHGGVAQGIGQAVMEHAVYDAEGQLLTGTFMDYALPRAGDVPFISFHSEPVPSTANPMGVKGCGEAGTVGALPAVVNAALDALWPLGVRSVDMPLQPERVWHWIREAQND